jgi:ribonuclease E
MKKEMLINVMQPEECRIAILEDGVLEELYVERTSHESYVGNIYKGRIVNIEPSIQAAFVDFGVGRNGFLHVSDVEPAYYRHLEQRRSDDRGRRNGGHGFDRDRGRSRPPTAPPEGGERDDEIEALDLPERGGTPPAEDSPPRGEGDQAGQRYGEAGRGRGRRRRREGPEGEPSPTAAPEVESRDRREASAGEEPASQREAAQPHESAASESGHRTREEPSQSEEPSRTEFMGSAERRTEEDNAPSEAVQPASMISDEELFFPRSQSQPGEPPTDAVSASEPEEEHPVEEPVATTRDQEPDNWDEPEGAGLSPAEPDLSEEDEAEQIVEQRLSEFREDDEAPRPRRPRDDRGRRGRRFRGAGRPGAGRPKPLIQDIFKRGQEVLVQVIKEGIGTKGPTLSTYISIAGRYLVLMPGLNRVGVSRKIGDDEQRRRLREIFHELQPPRGLGFIIRTAGLDKNKKELQRDLAYLSRLWQVVVRRIRKLKAPAEIYQESDMITRTIRDTFSSDIDTIWVDEPTAFEHAQEFLQIVMPRYASRIKLYQDPEPLFYKYGIEEEIARIQQRHIPLPNGGSIVIDQTEALVAIDVNSGNFRVDNNAEETAYQMNLLAAKEIARQLRLRDLGGVIVNDFIDMREEKHRRGVERALREAVKRDRARTKLLKMSAFGIIEMTRQRIRPSLKRSVYQDCPYCHNTGQVKTCESMSIEVMRLLQLAAHKPTVQRVQIRVAEEVASYLHNKKRREICRLEEAGNITVTINGQFGVSPETLEFLCYDNNNEVKLFAAEEVRPRRR